ncbi:unnamed protein product [Chilo suppressalis]|uniref:Uncharacterized protein n=1 Tax=Chilo suppressalis TaxID=168631 RepID=A0ABN8B013_CHISP|nr:unnamed protein product [Chilo suppressalis]
MEMWWFLLLVASVVSVNGSMAPFIEACREGDRECLLASARRALPVVAAGVPALAIGALDPLHIARVRTDNAGLVMEFTNTVIKGLGNSEVLKLERSDTNMELTLKSSLMMAGDYKMSGKLLVMPIQGEGKYKIRIKDMVTRVSLDWEAVGGFWRVRGWHHDARVLTGAHFSFQNLFNGNKKLSDALHQFANSNWREIFQEVAPPMVEKTVAMIVQEVTKLFDKVPISELVKS